MSIQDHFEQLQSQYSLKDADFYFLDLIPLINIIWADDHNQENELKLLYKFVIEHISHLDQQAELHVVTIEQANDFLDRFAHQKPHTELLNELQVISTMACKDKDPAKKESIFQYCLDIAAACTTRYPYGPHERICQSEKQLLQKLFTELDI